MKILLKSAAALLAAAMLFSAAGCKGSSGSGKGYNGDTVTIASAYIKEDEMVPGRNADTDRLLKRIDEVEKEYNVKIEFKQVDAGTYWKDMATNAMSNTPFGDIMETTPWYAGALIAAGAIRDISGISKNLGIDFNDGTWSRVVAGDMTYGSEIYGFNRERDAVQVLCLYNKKLFSAAGLTDPNELIAQNKKWDFSTFRDYARRLVKYDSAGEITQWGVGTTCKDMVLAGLIMSNGGAVVDYDEKLLPKLAVTDAKALTAVELFNNMVNTDKSLEEFSYKKAAEFLPTGKLGMLLCEEWVLDEYINTYAAESNIDRSEYGLTYFPLGPSGTDYIDPSMGGNAMFIPKGLSDERAEMVLKVYAALYAPDKEITREQETGIRADELFGDETSAEVYSRIVLDGHIKSNSVSRVGLHESFLGLTDMLMQGGGTPSSIINGLAPEMQACVDDSPYTAVIKKQIAQSGK